MSAEAGATIAAIAVIWLMLVVLTAFAFWTREKTAALICAGCLVLIGAALVCFVDYAHDLADEAARCEASGGVLIKGSQPASRVCVRGQDWR